MTFDPEKLGLKVGLEIHQQLSGTKLFCNCKAELLEGEPDTAVSRTLRASAGETGTVDAAAAEAQAREKRYTYQAYDDGTCLVELDEEPPHPVNAAALRTAVMVSKAFGSTILPTVQFMRKTIVDGSAVSGFQRTGLVALGGSVPGHDVGIQTIMLEEDSAKIVSRQHDADVFNLTRLGIPLLEIATAPDITTPEQAKEVAAQIGMVLRSTKRVKRGLGTIRQDLNVSIIGGARNEVKGCQDLRMIPTIITYETLRQQKLLEIRDKLKTVDVGDPADVTDAFRNSKGFIEKTLASGGIALGICVSGFSGVFGTELCPGYRVGTEFAGIAKTWGFGGVIHSDEDMEKYGTDRNRIEKILALDDGDAFLVLVGDEQRIRSLIATLFIPRLRQFLKGVPQEVRRANPDGTTSYLRPVPGAARMYPETDIPIVNVDTDVQAPKLLTEHAEDLAKETGLSGDLVKEIVARDIPIAAYKERYANLGYAFLSSALVEWPREIESRLKTTLPEPLAYVEPLLAEADSGRLAQSSVKAILEEIGTRNKKEIFPASDVLDLAKQYGQMPEEELVRIVEQALADNKGASVNALMGVVMGKTKGRADGKHIMKLLQERT